MSEQNKDQVAQLSAQLNALENESQRLLAALSWSSTVRNILLLCFVAFVVVFGWLYYSLYREIKDKKLVQLQAMLSEQQDELLQPVSQEALRLAQEVAPDVLTVVQNRVQADGKKFVKAFNAERDILNQNLQLRVEESANKLYEKLLDSHEKILQEEFPELRNEAAQAKLHDNLGKTYRQLVQRYYIDYFHKEIERMALAVDQFPIADADDSKGPLAQQVLYELMEMVQMMMVGPSDDLNLKATRESFTNPAGSQAAPANEQPKNETTGSGGK